jgi:hypothetical protein
VTFIKATKRRHRASTRSGITVLPTQTKRRQRHQWWVDDACALGWGAARQHAMVGAKAARHHGVPEVILSFATVTKNLGNS